ncbi:MAG: tetratricopeptide repeat protein, partial [Candidatus Omnitrophota bacterium]
MMRKINPLLIIFIVYVIIFVSMVFFYTRTKLTIKDSLLVMDVLLKDRVEDEIKRLQGAVRDKKQENESLRAGISAYVARQKWLENRIDDLNSEKNKLLDEIGDLSKKIRELGKLKNDYENVKTKLEEAKEQNNQLIEYRKNIEPKYRQMVYKSEELEAEMKRVKQEQDRRESRIAYNLGVIYTEKGKYDEAVEQYIRAIELDPVNVLAYYNLGIVYEEFLKTPEQAIEAYKKYIELNPLAEDI